MVDFPGEGRIFFLTSHDADAATLAATREALPAGFPAVDLVTAATAMDPALQEAVFERASRAGVAIVRLVGGPESTGELFQRLIDLWRERGVPVIAQRSYPMPNDDMAPFTTATPDHAAPALEMLLAGGKGNFDHLLRYLSDTFLGTSFGWEPATELPWEGVYHPALDHEPTVEELMARHWVAGWPAVGILFYRSLLQAGDTTAVDALVAELEALDLNVLPLYVYGPPGGDPGDGPGGEPPPPSNGDAPAERHDRIGDPAQVRAPEIRRPDQRERAASGRRMETRSDSRRGRHTGSRRPAGAVSDPDILATVQAAALRGGAACDGRLAITRQDLREKVRETLAATLILFVVDASGSMGARRRMEAAKGAVFSLLVDAYQHRDRVALVAFRGTDAEVLLPPTNSVDQAHRALATFATGGRTPLAAGLERAAELVVRAQRREPGIVPLVVLVSDGRANVAAGGADPVAAATGAASVLRETGARGLIIDTEQGYIRLGLARELSHTLGGDYAVLDEISAESVARAVRDGRAAVTP